MSDIFINYSQDILQGTLELLEASELKNLIHADMKISVKPNMVLAKPPSLGATTHSEVVEALIIYLRDFGVRKIEIIESAWIGGNTKQAYKVCGYEKLSEKYSVPLFDLKDDSTRKIKAGDFNFDICGKALDADFLINVPVLKAHCQTLMTCNLKNLKGCISDSEKRRFHTLGLHRPIAFLNKAVQTHFCLVDGICGDLTFEEGGNPVTRNMIIAGRDPLMIDSYCAELLGYKATEIEYINIASKLNIGELYSRDKSSVTELNGENKPKFTEAKSGIVKQLAAYINEDRSCSACYSSLVYALHNARGVSRSLKTEKINIGQGFKGKSGKLGCGNCTSGFDKFVGGCPPKAADIAAFLKQL